MCTCVRLFQEEVMNEIKKQKNVKKKYNKMVDAI